MIKPNPPETIARRHIANVVRVLVLAAFLFTAFQGSADAASLGVLNSSGETIYKVYVAQAGSKGWGTNVLNGTLRNGGSLNIPVPNGLRYVKVRVDFSGGRYKYWDSVDLYRINFVDVTRY